MEKVALRAWKKNYGSLSHQSIQKLRNSKILNHVKELDGLDIGTENILKKNNAVFYDATHPEYSKKYKRIAKRYNINPDNIGTMTDLNMKFGQSDADAFANNKAEVLMTPNPLGRMQNKIRKLSRFENRYLRAIIKRHEADEIRMMRKLLTDKYRIASHVHPNILKYESENSAIAPDKVRNAMTSFRKQTYEAPYFKRKYGLKYGKEAKNI